jgi:hypothetical protein
MSTSVPHCDRTAAERGLLHLVPRCGESPSDSRDWKLTIVAGDTKAGTLIAKDKFGNKYYENLEEELPCEHNEILIWMDTY